jgi:uncharacterized OB-fold protein
MPVTEGALPGTERARIVPAETELTAPYWSAAREGVIALQRCTQCGHVWHPPAPVCPRCRSMSYEWIRSRGRGTLYSYTTVMHAAHPAIAAAVPYRVALVDLEEGPRVILALVDADGGGKGASGKGASGKGASGSGAGGSGAGGSGAGGTGEASLVAGAAIRIVLGTAPGGLELPVARLAGGDSPAEADPVPPA